LWLIKVWFSASTFGVKIATFAKRQTVSGHCKKTDRPSKYRQKYEGKKSQRFGKIKRGATQRTSQPTVAPHLLLPQRIRH